MNNQNERKPENATFADTLLKELGPDFRWELAFAELTEDMVERLRAYGSLESLPAGVMLYTHGDRGIDMFVVLEGEVDIFLPSADSSLRRSCRLVRRSNPAEHS
jgi:CRP-like cAMP-binding protein